MAQVGRTLWLGQRTGVHAVIGMVHLGALPGSPGFVGPFSEILAAALRDGEALAQGGVDALLVENFGDAPFFPGRVPAHVVAHMTAIACALRESTNLPLGINVLRNDALSALAVATASDAAFVRVNVLCGARVTDQGILQGLAHELLRERAVLGAGHVRVLADVDVKHSAPLGLRLLAEEVEEALHRGGADAVIASGSGTGKPTDLEQLQGVYRAAAGTPVLVGSGATAETAGSLAPYCDGFIVGTAFKHGGVLNAPVDPARVQAFLRALGR